MLLRSEVEALFGIDLLVRVSHLEILLDEVTFDDTPVTALQWVPLSAEVLSCLVSLYASSSSDCFEFQRPHAGHCGHLARRF
jgi:hypothetical protein